MGYFRRISDHADRKASALQTSDCGFAAGTRSTKIDFTLFIPRVMASLAAFCAATVAAKADDLRDPAKFAFPAEDQEITFPAKSVIAMIVLLKVALT